MSYEEILEVIVGTGASDSIDVTESNCRTTLEVNEDDVEQLSGK